MELAAAALVAAEGAAGVAVEVADAAVVEVEQNDEVSP